MTAITDIIDQVLKEHDLPWRHKPYTINDEGHRVIQCEGCDHVYGEPIILWGSQHRAHIAAMIEEALKAYEWMQFGQTHIRHPSADVIVPEPQGQTPQRRFTHQRLVASVPDIYGEWEEI